MQRINGSRRYVQANEGLNKIQKILHTIILILLFFCVFKVSNSFTMEATFCGTNICRGNRRHFSSVDFEEMGRTFCEVALEYHKMQQNKKYVR